jgi:ectoine hydroxylase-related dioxygenase (phytanoyl-CoA dioxygenase family)
MQAAHLPSTASAQNVVAALRENGYVIVDNLATSELMDCIDEEMSPYVQSTAYSPDSYLGLRTKRTGRMIARSPAARELIMNRTVLGTAELFLEKSTTFQLHLTQVISVFPGSPAQPMHRDEAAWDFFQFPKDFDVMCNVLWAMSDYTEEMGATRIVPFSHLNDRNDYTIDDSIAAEMSRGSALFYTGKVFHGAGANVSGHVRQAINITYARGWLRQEENQYLSTPLEVAKTLPEDLLRLMGYQPACFSMGYVGEYEDPISVVRPEFAKVMSVADLQSKTPDSDLAARVWEATR